MCRRIRPIYESRRPGRRPPNRARDTANAAVPEIAVPSVSHRPASRAAVPDSFDPHGSASDKGARSGSVGHVLAPSAGGPEPPPRATRPSTRIAASVVTSSRTRQISRRRTLPSGERARFTLDANGSSGIRIARHSDLAHSFPVLRCVRVGQTAQARRAPDGGPASLTCRPAAARSRAEERPRPTCGHGHLRTSHDCPFRHGAPRANEPPRRSRESAASTLFPAKNRPERTSLAQPPRARCRSPCQLTAPAPRFDDR